MATLDFSHLASHNHEWTTLTMLCFSDFFHSNKKQALLLNILITLKLVDMQTYIKNQAQTDPKLARRQTHVPWQNFSLKNWQVWVPNFHEFLMETHGTYGGGFFVCMKYRKTC